MAFTIGANYGVIPAQPPINTLTANGILLSGQDGLLGAVDNYNLTTHTPYARFALGTTGTTIQGKNVFYGYVPAGAAVIAAGAACSGAVATGIIVAGGGMTAPAAFNPTATQNDYGWIST